MNTDTDIYIHTIAYMVLCTGLHMHVQKVALKHFKLTFIVLEKIISARKLSLKNR
jgi:hypothetical protein